MRTRPSPPVRQRSRRLLEHPVDAVRMQVVHEFDRLAVARWHDGPLAQQPVPAQGGLPGLHRIAETSGGGELERSRPDLFERFDLA